MKLLQNADTRVGYAASFFLQNQENVRKKRIVQQISIAYNEITSCVVALREMEKKLFDILQKGDIILVKASRGMAFDEICQMIK